MKWFVIWSEEHGAWWKPGHTGYTRQLVRAGRYEKAEAESIVAQANEYCKAGTFEEVAMPDPLDPSDP